ncbi:MAG: hypothetical protein WBF97_15460 [Comamonas sp.]|jgi:hypothetical protein
MADMSAAEVAAEIAKSPETQQALLGMANQIAEEATQEADSLVGDLKDRKGNLQHGDAPHFGTDVTVGTDAARAHVWAANGPAIHAERKAGVLAKAADQYGKGHDRK